MNRQALKTRLITLCLIASWPLRAHASPVVPAQHAPSKVTISKHAMKAQWQETQNQLLDCGESGSFTGVTEWFYHCRPRFEHHVETSKRNDETFAAVVRIEKVAMVLDLTVKTRCGPKEITRRHERGHVEICRRIYESLAEKAARRSCQSAIGRQFAGSGRSEKEAIGAAQAAAARFICRQYTRDTASLAEQVAKAYDDITEHGRNKVDPDRAIEQAFRRVLNSK